MTGSCLSFDIVPSNVAHPVGVEVWVNHHCIVDVAQLDQQLRVEQQFSDEIEQQHTVKIVLKNKTQEHTQINQNLEIVSDSVIEIKNLALDGLDISSIISQLAVYYHSFNSQSTALPHRFYNTMGCNGVVEFSISTPAYLWLLEHQ